MIYRLHLQGQVRENDEGIHRQQETNGETARRGTGERAVPEEKCGKKGQFHDEVSYTLVGSWLPELVVNAAISLVCLCSLRFCADDCLPFFSDGSVNACLNGK